MASKGAGPAAAPLAGAGADAPAAAAAPAKKETISNWSTKKLVYMLRVINMINGLLLIACAILVFLIAGACGEGGRRARRRHAPRGLARAS